MGINLDKSVFTVWSDRD